MAFEILTERTVTWNQSGSPLRDNWRSWHVTNYRIDATLDFPEFGSHIEIQSLYGLPNPVVILSGKYLRDKDRGVPLVVLPMKLQCKSRLSRLAYEFARQVYQEECAYWEAYAKTVERQHAHA